MSLFSSYNAVTSPFPRDVQQKIFQPINTTWTICLCSIKKKFPRKITKENIRNNCCHVKYAKKYWNIHRNMQKVTKNEKGKGQLETFRTQSLLRYKYLVDVQLRFELYPKNFLLLLKHSDLLARVAVCNCWETTSSSESLKVNLVPRVSFLPVPWSGRGDEGPWERGCLKVRYLVIRSLAHCTDVWPLSWEALICSRRSRCLR